MRWLSLLVLSSPILGGCAAVGEYLDQEMAAARKRDLPEIALAKRVAFSQRNQSYADNLVTKQGYYGGRLDHDCHRVSVHTVQYRRTEHYKVCGPLVLAVNQVAPRMPPENELGPMRTSLSKAAWASGKAQAADLGEFSLEAIPIGPADGAGCRIVEERLTYGSQLVELREQRVCP